MNRIVGVFPVLLLAACHREAPRAERRPSRRCASRRCRSTSRKPGALFRVDRAGKTGEPRIPGIRYVTDLHRLGLRGLEPGDLVAAGTALARIREEDYRNTTSQAQSQLDGAREAQRSARAQLAQAEASGVKAEADFRRATSLIESHSPNTTRQKLNRCRYGPG